jgi:hypothetical protein
MYAFANPLIYFSTQVVQYASDSAKKLGRNESPEPSKRPISADTSSGPASRSESCLNGCSKINHSEDGNVNLSRSNLVGSNNLDAQGLPNVMSKGRHKPWRVALTSAQVNDS